MTLEAPPRQRVPPPIPVRATVREAWQVIITYPRQTLLPMFVIEAPVAVISAIATAILYLTAFKGEAILTPTDLLNSGSGGPLFAFFAISAFEVLFAQVARGATIVGVAAARQQKSRALSELLDPAFTRMGGLIALAVISTAIVVLGAITAITIIGFVIGIFIFLRWAVAFEAFILEERGVFGAFGRSWGLMRGNMLRYLGVLFVSFVWVVVPFVLISLLQLIIGGSRTMQIITTAIVTVAQGILVVPILVFLTAVTTVFYFKAKERSDDRNLVGE